MGSWNPEEVLAALDTERQVVGLHKTREIAARKLRDAAPAVADSLIWLALYSQNEGTRLAAARDVLDRVYGKTGNTPMRIATDAGSIEQTVVELYNGDLEEVE